MSSNPTSHSNFSVPQRPHLKPGKNHRPQKAAAVNPPVIPSGLLVAHEVMFFGRLPACRVGAGMNPANFSGKNLTSRLLRKPLKRCIRLTKKEKSARRNSPPNKHGM